MSSPLVECLLAAAAALPPNDQAELLRRLREQLRACQAQQGAPDPGYHRNPVCPQEYAALTYQIIGGGMRVHTRFGRSHAPTVYRTALVAELRRIGLAVQVQRPYAVHDAPGEPLRGYYIADLVVDNCVLVEIKAQPSLGRWDTRQVIAYLKASGCPVGLALNFGERLLGVRRILPPTNYDNYAADPRWLVAPEALDAAAITP